MANTNLNVNSNYTGNKNVKTDDLITTMQGDMKSLFGNYLKSQNVLYSALVKTAAYTCTSSDSIILVDTNNTVTITLPTAVGNRGKTYTIKDWAGNANTKNITVATTGGQTIDGGALTMTVNYGFRTVVSDNANWFIIGS